MGRRATIANRSTRRLSSRRDYDSRDRTCAYHGRYADKPLWFRIAAPFSTINGGRKAAKVGDA